MSITYIYILIQRTLKVEFLLYKTEHIGKSNVEDKLRMENKEIKLPSVDYPKSYVQ